jgi:glucan phosphorylase
VESLLNRDDYMLLADYQACVDCQLQVSEAYRDQKNWTRMSIREEELFNRLKGEAQEYLTAKVQELKEKGLINVKPMVKCGDAADEIISTARYTQ